MYLTFRTKNVDVPTVTQQRPAGCPFHISKHFQTSLRTRPVLTLDSRKPKHTRFSSLCWSRFILYINSAWHFHWRSHYNSPSIHRFTSTWAREICELFTLMPTNKDVRVEGQFIQTRVLTSLTPWPYSRAARQCCQKFGGWGVVVSCMWRAHFLAGLPTALNVSVRPGP